MNKELEAKWAEAEANPGKSVPIGRIVVCDSCNDDFTDSPESGGFLFVTSAYCPACAKKSLPTIIGYGEEHFIRARCPAGQSFADFVRAYRGPDASVKIGSLAQTLHKLSQESE